MRYPRLKWLLAGASIAALMAAAPVGFDPSHGTVSWHAAQASSCFVGTARVLMADLSLRPIRTLRPGDLVLGAAGRANRVIGVERPCLGARKLYAFNGGSPFVTAEHPFLTPDGWKSLDPSATAAETPAVRVGRLRTGDLLSTRRTTSGSSRGALALAPQVVDAWEALTAVQAATASPDLPLYNLLLDGDHSYVVEGFVVHNKDGGGESEGAGESAGSSDDGGASGSESESSGSESSGSGSGGDDGHSGSGSSGSDDSGRNSHRGGRNEGHDTDASGLDKPFGGDATPTGGDLSSDEEAAAISRGWR
jgi:hypothetical protein